MMKLHFFLVLVLVLIKLALGNVWGLSRINSDGILYEHSHPRSKSILFSKTLRQPEGINDWRNLSMIVDKYGMQTKSMFCVFGKGGWLVYPEENFKVGNAMNVQILVGETCIRSNKAYSLQPLGPINKRIGSSSSSGLLTFDNVYFTSEYKLINSNEVIVSGRIKSLIHAGPRNWTIEGYILARNGSMLLTGTPLCLTGMPYQEKEIIFCAVADIDNLFGETEQLDKVVIKRDCKTNDTQVEMQKCYSTGNYRILVESEILPPPSKCKKYLRSTENRQIQEYSHILQIWKLRMTIKSKEKMKVFHTDDAQPEIATLDSTSSQPHLHDLLTKTMDYLVPRLGSYIQYNCPDLSLEYAKAFLHLFKVISQEIFNFKRNYSDKLEFVNVLSSFNESMNSCRSINNTLNSNGTFISHMRQNETHCNFSNATKPEPFVKFFPEAINFVSQNCFYSEDLLSKEFLQFLPQSHFNWTLIYENGLNGMNVKEQEQIILHCLKIDRKVEMEDFNNANTIYEKVSDLLITPSGQLINPKLSIFSKSTTTATLTQ